MGKGCISETKSQTQAQSKFRQATPFFPGLHTLRGVAKAGLLRLEPRMKKTQAKIAPGRARPGLHWEANCPQKPSPPKKNPPSAREVVARHGNW